MRLIAFLLLAQAALFAACGGQSDDMSAETKPAISGRLAASPVPVEPADAAVINKAMADRQGKVVLLNMWATWCTPCVEEFPDMVALHRKYRDRGLEVVAVSHDFRDQIESHLFPFLEKYDAGFTHFFMYTDDESAYIDEIDPEWSGALPATFLYDRAGNKVEYIDGKFDTAELEAKILELLK